MPIDNLNLDKQLLITSKNLIKKLDNWNINYKSFSHAPVMSVQEAKLIQNKLFGFDKDKGHIKNLYLRDKRKNNILLVAHQDASIDLKLLAKIIKMERLSFGSPDRLMENLGVLPGAVSPFAMINGANKNVSLFLDNSLKSFRIILEKFLRIHRNAKLPKFASKTAKNRHSMKTDIVESQEKVAIFTTCYHNYNEPIIIDDLVSVLKHNNINPEVIMDDKCCGMPKLELGDLKTVEKIMHHNIQKFKKYVDNDYKIIAPVPSCVLMFKQELPLLFPDNKDIKNISQALRDPFEYLLMLHEKGKLKTDFTKDIGSVFYQVACHQRVQNIGQVTKKILELVPNTDVEALERCSGHDGTYGVKKETHEIAIKIATPIVREYKKNEASQFTSDCTLAAHHIVNAMGNKVMPTHPISLIKKAYGI